MPKFLLRKRPFFDDENEYNEQVDNLKKKVVRFPVFVITGLVLVALVVAIILIYNISNNSLRILVKSTSKSMECGGFDYRIVASIDGENCMEYDGTFALDLKDRSYTSVYHATYSEYEYDSVVYANAEKSYRGNCYGGKWNIEDYTASALDFMDFYKDFRKFKFDGSSAVRFAGLVEKFNARQFGKTVNELMKDLSRSRNLRNVMHQTIRSDANGMVVTYTPDMEKLYDMIISEIASSYTNANEYRELKKKIERNRENIRNAELHIVYKTNADDYLTDFSFTYKVDGKEYSLSMKLSNFNKVKPVVPDSFFVAAGIE